ncbi:hypothetical protein ABW20_dc0103502 [Dactylellina cionopaga]|nr:hypothetical protein ABW20_dc0103502 [Dactylellina cionopaga]
MYAYTVYYLWKENLPFTSHLFPSSVAAHDVEATTQDAFSHKDDHMLDPQEDEHEHEHEHEQHEPPYHQTVTPIPGGVYAPLSSTAVGQGRWQGEDDDDDADFSRDGYRNQHNVSVLSDQGGRNTPLTGHQDPYTDRVQQPVEFPDGPYNSGYRY